MRIFHNLKKINDIDILLQTPAIENALKMWGHNGIFEKSSIDLSIFQTPFGSISLLYGPRQIGKTSALRQFLTITTDCQTLIYLDCSIILEHRDLYDCLSKTIEGNTSIVLDEVQGVNKWYLALRSLADEGLLKKCRVWCTGSEARYLLESGERLPGRKGMGKVVFARPWTFREYLELFYPEKIKSYSKVNYQHVNQKWLDSQEIDLSKEWKNYQFSGGFPQVVGSMLTQNEIPDQVWRVYEDWILGNWSHLRTSERSLRKISQRFIKTINSRVSYEALKKETDIQSANTVRALVEIQEDHFSVRVLSKYDLAKKAFLPAKLKKLYPIDPFIALVYFAIGNSITRLYEDSVFLNSLDECTFYSQTLKYQQQNSVGYLYNEKSKTEIDFYFNNCGFELKSQGRPSLKQKELLRMCPHSFVVKKEHLPLISYLIGESRNI